MNENEIKIVPDNRVIPIAVSAAQEYARYYFKNEKNIKATGMALEEAIANITEGMNTEKIRKRFFSVFFF
ncbi:MAG: hypothetical protein Q3985_02225 [Eubacteriales bacterium]|nr:hypothetical protein [Eubacteriales bacterium]